MSMPSRAWGENTADEAVGALPSEPILDPLTVVFRDREAGRTASFIEPLPQLPMLASWKSVPIAIEAMGRILLIDAADLVAVEASGNYVLSRRRSTSQTLRESMATMEQKVNPHGFGRVWVQGTQNPMDQGVSRGR